MAKDNLQLISVRIDPDTLQKIDELTKRHRYWKRNTIINAILTSVMNAFSESDIYNLIRYHSRYDKVETAEFKIADRHV